MNLSSDRLILKELTWKDLDYIHTLHSYLEVEEFNTIGIPGSVDDTREIIRTAIEDQHSENSRIAEAKAIRLEHLYQDDRRIYRRSRDAFICQPV